MPGVAHETTALVELVVVNSVVPDHTLYRSAKPPVGEGKDHDRRTWVGSDAAALRAVGALGVTQLLTVLLAELCPTELSAYTRYRQPRPPGTAVVQANDGNDELLADNAVEPKLVSAEYVVPPSIDFVKPKPVIGLLPALSGASQVNDTAPTPGPTETTKVRGAEGGATTAAAEPASPVTNTNATSTGSASRDAPAPFGILPPRSAPVLPLPGVEST